MKLKSKKANDIPGDTTRELTTAAIDSDGRSWPAGTRFQPLAGGYDNVANTAYATVMMDGKRTFSQRDQK